MIKLICIKCGYSYSVSENEYLLNIQYHTHCFLCQGELVTPLEEIVKTDIYAKAEAYLHKWFSQYGIEKTLEILARNKEQPNYRIYEELLKKKGLIK